MASIHLTGCGLAGKRSLPCFDGLRFSQPAFGVSSSLGASGAILGRRCFRGLVVKAATVVAPKYTTIKPLGERVLVKLKTYEEKTTGGILLPTAAQTKPQGGKVVAVCEGRTVGKKKVDICVKIFDVEVKMKNQHFKSIEGLEKLLLSNSRENNNDQFWRSCSLVFMISSWFSFCQVAQSSVGDKTDVVYEIGELFELGIQLSYLLILLGLLGLGTFFVIRQVLVRRELDLSAKELQEQVRSGDASATEYFELGAVMLRRKFYPAATKYLQQAIEKWDRDDQDLAQVYNALGVSYVRDDKVDKGIAQFEAAVKLQPGYVTAWNNLGDAYEKKKNLKMALRAFEQVILFDPNNKIARPRRDALRERVQLYKGVPLKSENR